MDTIRKIPLLLAMLCLAFGLPKIITVNISPSIPVGIYKRIPQNTIQKGTIVRISKHFHGRPHDLLKIITAIPKDPVFIDSSQYLAAGKDWTTKPTGTPPPILPFQGPTPEHHVFVAGTHPNSYDSRYFGPVSFDHIKAVYKPFFVSKNHHR